MANNLHDKVIACQKNLYEKELLIKEISEEVYNYPNIWKSFTEDMRTDFYLTFYPRIEKLIFKYRTNDEYIFDSYLKHHLKLYKYSFIRNYGIKCKKEQLVNQEAYYEEIDRITNHNNEKEDKSFFFYNLAQLLPHEKNAKRLKTKALRNRFMVLILYYSYYVSESEIILLSDKLSICPALFCYYYKRIQKCFEKSYEIKLKELFNKHNNSYFRKKMCQLELNYETDSDKISKLKRIEKFWSNRYNSIQKKITNLEYPKPTHEHISRITGIKRGTVSTSIYYLKKSLIKYKKAFNVSTNRYYQDLF